MLCKGGMAVLLNSSPCGSNAVNGYQVCSGAVDTLPSCSTGCATLIMLLGNSFSILLQCLVLCNFFHKACVTCPAGHF